MNFSPYMNPYVLRKKIEDAHVLLCWMFKKNIRKLSIWKRQLNYLQFSLNSINARLMQWICSNITDRLCSDEWLSFTSWVIYHNFRYCWIITIEIYLAHVLLLIMCVRQNSNTHLTDKLTATKTVKLNFNVSLFPSYSLLNNPQTHELIALS